MRTDNIVLEHLGRRDNLCSTRGYYLALLIVALLSRWAVLGNPFIYADEEFYLFTGGQMLHGALPFVDIWDRKPVGLFLFYAFFHLFGPWRIYAYQIGALLSAWGTACLMFGITRRIAPSWGAFLSGALYLIWLIGVHGEGGQSSVFYGILVSFAVWLIIRRLSALTEGKMLRWTGMEVMVLLGLSMQIKYTTLFEGVYLGCLLLWLGRRSGRSLPNIFVDGGLWVSIALVPTALVFGDYALCGHGRAWWFANVESMFLHHGVIGAHDVKSFLFISIILFIGAGLSWLYRPRGNRLDGLAYKILLGWALAAFIGYCAMREFPKHYAIPLLPPFFVLAALLWRRRIGQVWLAILVIIGVVRGYGAEKRDRRGPGMKGIKAVQQVVSSPRGCAFMFSGQSILLDMIPYCPLTAYPFPAHLSFENERDALGVNPVQELRRILAKRPLYLLDSRSDDHSEENPQTRQVFDETVRRFYSRVYEHNVNERESDIIIYKRITP